jgi:hypothetical protein
MIAVIGIFLAFLPPAQGQSEDGVIRAFISAPEGTLGIGGGAFLSLRDGRIMYAVFEAYAVTPGDPNADNWQGHIVARYSDDGGATWTDHDDLLLANEGLMNTSSPTLFRLSDDRIAMFYLVKNSLSDCREYVRFSSDEGQSWSDRTLCMPDEGYYVTNNDRVIQLQGGPHEGRFVVPAALHCVPGEPWEWGAQALCYLSDDGGATWRRSEDAWNSADAGTALQEPGVVELADGRLMMFCRTGAGSQYLSYSEDGGDTWTVPAPSTIRSPLSPASIKRIPGTADLLLAWNDNYDPNGGWMAGARTPLNVAISSDHGSSWEYVRTIEDDPAKEYSYTAIGFVDDRVLLGFGSGDVTEIAVFAVPEPGEFPVTQFLGAYSAAAAGQIERADGQGPGWTEAIGTLPDGLWGQSPILNRNYNFDHASFPAGEEALEAAGRDGEDCPVMDWTVPVPQPGTYDVWVRFGGIDNLDAFRSTYGIYAGLESAEDLTFCTGSSAGFKNVSAGPYHRDGRVYLGHVTATNSFHLFFDDMGVLDPGFGIDPKIFGIEISALIFGDANRDGKVDDLDASILGANWQRTGGATWDQGDFNQDGNVNDIDAAILAAHCKRP